MAPRSEHEQAARSAGMQRHAMGAGMLVALVVVGAWLFYRNLGLNPAIFADEWYYSKMARLMALKDATVPSYLYLWLFHGTTACGAGFLECARAANVVLFLAGAPFVYLVARAFCDRLPAAVITLLSMLAPLNAFTAFFMPEATYYFAFCVLSWIALTRSHWGWPRQALASGAMLGLMSLVKVHALFLLPALCLFQLYARWHRGAPWFADGLAAMLLAAAAALAVRFGLGFLLAGDAALSLFGPFYQGAVNAAGSRSVLALLPPALVNARGHLMALAILFALPLALLVHGLVRHAGARADRRHLLHLYTLLMLGAATGVTVLFTASIASPGTQEGLRLHLRYYSFVFPLLWIVAAAAIGNEGRRREADLRWGISVVLVALIAAALGKLPSYALNPADGAEVFALRLPHWSGVLLAGLQALVLVLWALRNRWAAPLFVYVALPALTAAGLVVGNSYLKVHVREQAADMAGKFAHSYVPASEHAQIVVAGADLSQLMRAQFHIDHKDSSVLELAPGQPLHGYQIPIEKKWLLVVGQHALPATVTPVVARPHFALVKINTGRRLVSRADFSAPFGTGFIARAEGLSGAEAWGRWSDGKQVVLHFTAPLPTRVNLTLKAKAFADNANQPFMLRIGAASAPFHLSAQGQQVGLRLDTDGKQRTLTIDVPHPVSPAELGLSGDQRKLGIGISHIEISAADGSVVAHH